MTKSAKIVFFGNERLATGVSTTVPVLRGLIDAGYQVCAVVTQHDQQARSRQPRPSEVMAVAAEHGIPVLLPHKMADMTDELRAYGAEAGILVAFGKIVPQSIIDIFPHGIVNLHPSLLPKHRGPTPLESVILSGDKTTGVSLMQLAKAMDAGPIYAQETIALTGQETKQELANQLLARGADMIIRDLPAILAGKLTGIPQDDAQATYDQLITKDAARLELTKPAAQLEREVRAYAGWPRSRVKVDGYGVIVTKAHVGSDGTLQLPTADGSLVIDELILPGKKPMSGRDFARGYLRD